jgi:hypothetical protein
MNNILLTALKKTKGAAKNVDDFITNGLKDEFTDSSVCKMAARGHALALGADIVDGSSDEVSDFIEDATDLSLWQCTGRSANSFIMIRIQAFVGMLIFAVIVQKLLFPDKTKFTENCGGDIFMAVIILTVIIAKFIPLPTFKNTKCFVNGRQISGTKCNRGIRYVLSCLISLIFIGIQHTKYGTDSCSILKKLNKLFVCVIIAILVFEILEIIMKVFVVGTVFKPEYALTGSILRYIF